MPDSLNGLLIIAFGVVPGYLFSVGRQKAVVTGTRESAQVLLESIAGSMVFWVIAGSALVMTGLMDSKPKLAILGIGIAAVVLPLGLGIFYGMLERGQRSLFGWNLIQTIPKAWDYRFSRGRPLWVLATFKDGTRIGGAWHENSFASSYPNEEDVFIETVVELDERGRFVAPLKGSAGVWIKASELKCLEFFQWEANDD